MESDFEAVIGLEVHAQLLTRTKAFCGCEVGFGGQPNTHVCPVCLGLPGALPVLNQEAVRMAVLAALALGCEVHPQSVFARKNYFYPDLPKGYQISQYEMPLATRGRLLVEAFDTQGNLSVERHVGITRIHMEEDAGKNLHGFAGTSVVDLNRAGTPLIEIVSEPDLRSSQEAAEYLRQLRALLMGLSICDGNMEQGSFRCDVNVSIRARGDVQLGTRTEIKNVNSFRFAQRAIDYEIARQLALVTSGGKVVQQTRGWDDRAGKTVAQRSKEEAHDYRYFPEPDLPPLKLDVAWVRRLRDSLPEAPGPRRRRFERELGLTRYAAGVMTSHAGIADFFEQASRLHGDAVAVANFVQSEVLRDAQTEGLEATFPVTSQQLAGLLDLVREGAISGKQAKDVYGMMRGTDQTAGQVVDKQGIRQITDAASIERVCAKVVQANPKQAEQYRKGKTGVLGFFVGQVMRETRGSASPQLVNDVLVRILSES